MVFAFEARRSSDSELARLFGGYGSDRTIQEEDSRDLAQDLTDVIMRNGQPRMRKLGRPRGRKPGRAARLLPATLCRTRGMEKGAQTNGSGSPPSISRVPRRRFRGSRMKSVEPGDIVELRGVVNSLGRVTQVTGSTIEVMWIAGVGAPQTVLTHPSSELDRKPHAASHPSIRWADIRRNQLGFVNNLCLGLAVGLVAFDANKLLDNPHPWLLTSLVLAALSALFGILTSVVRLASFRGTARLHSVATHQVTTKLRQSARLFDAFTWWFLWCQLTALALTIAATAWWGWTVLCCR